MICGSHATCYDKRSGDATLATKYVAELTAKTRHAAGMIGHAELLDWLHAERDAGRLTNAQLQKLLGLQSSRVSEIFDGRRKISLNEAKVIVEHFRLEESAPITVPARIPTAALTIVLDELFRSTEGAQLGESALRPLAEGLQRGLELLAKNPAIHSNPDALRAFAQAVAAPSPAAMLGA